LTFTYKKSDWSRDFYNVSAADIILHRAAKKYFNEQGFTGKLPSINQSAQTGVGGARRGTQNTVPKIQGREREPHTASYGESQRGYDAVRFAATDKISRPQRPVTPCFLL
jgi:hypothetical protein